MESDCCGAYTSMPEYGLCPECMEHCDFVSDEEEDLILDTILIPIKSK